MVWPPGSLTIDFSGFPVYSSRRTQLPNGSFPTFDESFLIIDPQPPSPGIIPISLPFLSFPPSLFPPPPPPLPSIPVFLRVSPPVRRRKIHVDPVMYANEFGPDKTRVGKSRQASFSVSNGHSVRAPASKSSVFPHFTYFQQEKDRRSVKQTT